MIEAMSEHANPPCHHLSSQGLEPAEARAQAGFVAINYIDCKPYYAEKFECLFCTRAHAIDRMDGFLGMQVLRANAEAEPYLIISWWKDEASFQAWTGSPEFLEGHKRGFEDIKKAREAGQEPPMTSRFLTYSVVTD
jgi:heme oxygenase (mycobilin-producing)